MQQYFVIMALILAVILSPAAAAGQASAPTAPLAEKIITPAGGVENDEFGFSVDIEGDTLVVGAPYADVGDNETQGAVYVFERNQGGPDNWGQSKKITAADGEAFDQFGYAVAISGDTLVVGSEEATVGSNSSQGAAYVFERNQGGANNWGQTKRLEGPSALIANLAEYGHAVDIDGDTIVIGSPAAGPSAPGAAFVYQRNEGGANNWGETAQLSDDVYDSNAAFGRAVAISGDLLVVGADAVDILQQYRNEGAAYVHQRNEGGADNWGRVQKLQASTPVGNAKFGDGIATDGETIVVGAWGTFDTYSGEGKAYVFSNAAKGVASWSEQQIISASSPADYQWFGNSVAVLGSVALAGAHGTNGDRGAVHRYGQDQGGANNWGWVERLTANTGNGSDYYGYDLAISAENIVIGAYGRGPGAVYLYANPDPPAAGCTPASYSNTTVQDIIDVASRWGNAAAYDAAYDANCNEVIDIVDILLVAAAFAG